MTHRVAVLGASGFIGSRIVEMFHLGGLAGVQPIVRSMGSLARLSRFDLDWRIADARDQKALRTALAGCETVVHAIAGDTATIRDSVIPVYHAAQEAGVRRLVYLSTASVHGQTPLSGTDDESPLSRRQPIAYNNAKVWAEQRLMALRAKGAVELVILRPGIVTGPRSAWQTRFASELLAGTACWSNDGRGICNSLYVDNLVHAVHLALTATGVDGESFLLGDAETVTWADLYGPVAHALGVDPLQLPNVDHVPPRRGMHEVADEFANSTTGHAIASLIPKRIRRGIRSVITPAAPVDSSPWAIPVTPATPLSCATLEMSLLYRCAWKLPDTKARRLLGYRPVVSFAEGCRRTIGWLGFAGFPIVHENNRSR